MTPAYQGAMQPTSGKAIASMVLGICSILGCMAYGLPGFVCGILAIVFHNQAKAQVAEGECAPSSMSMAKAGLVCGIVGLTLSSLVLLMFVAILTFGTLH